MNLTPFTKIINLYRSVYSGLCIMFHWYLCLSSHPPQKKTTLLWTLSAFDFLKMFLLIACLEISVSVLLQNCFDCSCVFPYKCYNWVVNFLKKNQEIHWDQMDSLWKKIWYLNIFFFQTPNIIHVSIYLGQIYTCRQTNKQTKTHPQSTPYTNWFKMEYGHKF